MKRRSGLLVVLASILTTGFTAGWPAVAGAEQMFGPVQQITVRGVVPERRAIVIDQQNTIRLVTSNTPHDVPPEVHLLAMTSQPVPLTDDVRRQYERLMSQVRGDKAVIIQPVPPPLAELFPSFTGRQPVAEYLVTPGRAELTPYWIR